MVIKVNISNKDAVMTIRLEKDNKFTISNNLNNKLEKFQINSNSQIWKKIIDRFSEIEVSFFENFRNKHIYNWKIDFTNSPLNIGNYLNVLPYYLKSNYIEKSLIDFQKTGKDWLIKDKKRILADDMGLGKTLQAIAAIEDLMFSNLVEKVLIVCPNSLLINWKNELRKWAPLLVSSMVNSQDLNDIIIGKKQSKY